MAEHFDEVLAGFWVTIKLSIVGGFFALIWGLILSILRQVPGKWLAPVRWHRFGQPLHGTPFGLAAKP